MLVSKGITTCLLKLFSTMCIFGLFTFDAHGGDTCFYYYVGSTATIWCNQVNMAFYKRSDACSEKNSAYLAKSGDTVLSSLPTATGKSFVGYYLTAGISEITKNNQSSGANMIIDKDGKLKSTNPISKDTQLYDVWARNCTTNPGANCNLSIDSSGVVKYTTSCEKGQIERSGTYDPICKAKFEPGEGSGGESSLYVCNIGGVERFCENSDCTNCTTPGNKVYIPTRTGYNFRGYYSTSGMIAQVINKDGEQVRTAKDFGNWNFKAQWVKDPCDSGYYYDEDSDNCYSCGSQGKYIFTSTEGPHDQPKEDVCYVTQSYTDEIGTYTLENSSGGNCTLGQFNGS